MASSSPALTLMLLVDALRPDYVARMPYLQSLARRSRLGRLRECFGFVPRAAYFGGLDAEQFGFTNMFCYQPESSPFNLGRWLPKCPGGAGTERAIGLRRLVEDAARSRVPPFAKDYVSTGDIPLRYLRYFDLVEKRAPWDRKVGFRSLFHEMDDAGIPWFQCSWPDSNRLADSSDAGIIEHALKHIRPEHRFAYVHVSELDGVGHCHGPNSAEMHRALARMDRQCQRLVTELQLRFPDPLRILLFGDHGMVQITRTFDVQEILEGLDLTYGADYIYFLDSSMVRFWFFHQQARQIVERALSRRTEGTLLAGEEDQRRFGIAGCHPGNGELIFLAHPGVLVFPNFFQGQGDPIKGMHGYDPDSPDNLGFLLWHDPETGCDDGRDIGPVNPPELYPLCRASVGLQKEYPSRWLHASEPARSPRRFTDHPDDGAESMVASQIDTIVQAVRERLGSFNAVVLTGSFGRAEGGVYQEEDGAFRPVNDYDLLVVSPTDRSAELQELSRQLPQRLGIDYVDLGWSDGQWEHWPNTVAHYDLRHGSQVVAGDASILQRFPDYASADLPIFEAVKLLLNRTAGLLTGLRGSFFAGVELTEREHRYLSNQIAKAWMAMGDWHLLRWQTYDSSYRLRRERLAALGPGAGLPPELVQSMADAYRFKCRPDYRQYPQPLQSVRAMFPTLETDLIHAVNLMAEGTSRDIYQAMDLYWRHMSADTPLRDRENRLAQDHPQMRPMLQPSSPPPFSYRHYIYAGLPLLLKAAVDPVEGGEAFAELRQNLHPWLRLPAGESNNPDHWEATRSLLVQAWFALCH